MEVKITLSLEGTDDLLLDIEEARQLYLTLKDLFCKESPFSNTVTITDHPNYALGVSSI